MVNELLKALQPQIKGLTYCSAPTNKAVSVLKEKISSPTKGTYFITTHAALKLKRVIDNSTGEIHFKPNISIQFPPLKGVKLFIIDEASMVPSELLGYIEEHATIQGAKVVFLGDSAQLNPVNEDDSPVFLGKPVLISKSLSAILKHEFKEQKQVEYEGQKYYFVNNHWVQYEPYPEVVLTEIVRQKGGNPIIDLSNNLSSINTKIAKRTDVGGFIYSYDSEKVLQTLAQVNGTDELKYLAYTNAEVDRINRLVRERIYGNPAKIEVGETMVFDEPYGEYYTNEEITIKKVIVREKDFLVPINLYDEDLNQKYLPIKMKYYSINYSEVEDDSGHKIIGDKIIVIHEDSEKDLKDCMTRMRQEIKISNIKWTDYYGFCEQFAKLKYNHAISIHKSQGSTYKQVIVNIRNTNICKNPKERKRLLYTAVTRASELLILFNV